MDYDLEIDKAAKEIEDAAAKSVCLQLPSGLKPYAKEIQTELEKKTDADIIIWAGSCFGACDVPLELKNLNVDLLLQWGHARWRY